MIKVILFGAAGRFGRLITAELNEHEDISLVACVESPGSEAIGKDNIISDSDSLPEAHAWIDSTIATAAMEHIRRASIIGMPFVVATTGFTEENNQEIEQLANSFPILIAPNLSAGIGAMDQLVEDASKLLGNDFEPALFELHHSAKLDSPSGTALRLAENVKTNSKSPQIVALRAGGAIGEHRMHFVGKYEELIITHRAWSRQAFSRGVPRALRFIVNQPPGLYTIRNIHSTT